MRVIDQNLNPSAPLELAYLGNMLGDLISFKCAAILKTQFLLQAVLNVMRQRNVSVDVQTFGCLALGCERQKEGLQLLADMEVIKYACRLTTHD